MRRGDEVALDSRLAELGRELARREAGQRDGLEQARECARDLHQRVATALDSFNAAVRESAPHLGLTLSDVRVDDKHVHSVQFDLRRGRYCAVVTVKSRGEVTLVGPFRQGKAEGPCRTFPMTAVDGLDQALEEFLAAFVEEALRP